VRQERLARCRNILGIEQHTSAEHKSMGYMWLELGQDQIQGQVRHRRLAVARAPLISKGYPAAGQPDIRTVRSGRRVWTGTSSELSSEHYPGSPAEGQRLGQWPWKGEAGASSPGRIIAGCNPEKQALGKAVLRTRVAQNRKPAERLGKGTVRPVGSGAGIITATKPVHRAQGYGPGLPRNRIWFEQRNSKRKRRCSARVCPLQVNESRFSR
jgi:hypothetical protein